MALRTPFCDRKEGYVDEIDEGLATYEPPVKDCKTLTDAFRPEAYISSSGSVYRERMALQGSC
ncbi:hypothetical protein IG631_22784 [Alternaria alternata]|nr:hypothetical protein IG631_22784 [Alternaria alternata]